MKFLTNLIKQHLNKLLLISFLLICLFTSASISEVEKAKSNLKKGTELFNNGNYDSSLIFLKYAESLLENSNEKQISIKINSQLAHLYMKLISLDSAFVYYNKNINLKRELGRDDSLTFDYIGIALTFLERGNADTALIFIDTARFYSEKTNQKNVSLENNTGRIYMDKGNFEKALEHFFVALEYAQAENDTLRLIFINLNIGTLYQRMKKLDNALEFYLRSYDLSILSNTLDGMASAYSIGIIYQNKGKYDIALEYNFKAIPICEKLGKYDDLSNIYSNMSNIYMLTKKYDKAEKMLRKSINMSSQFGLQRQLGIAYANMGKTKELMGQADSAVFYLKKSISVVKKLGAPNLLSAVYRLTSDAYEEGGDFENALNYHKKHIDLADSIFSEKVEQQIAELQTKYETEKKEKENNLLKKDIEIERRRAKYFLVLAIVLSLMGVISLALFYFIRNNAVNRKKLAELEAARLEDELESQKRELVLGALSLSRNIEFINSLIDELKDLSDNVSEKGIPILNSIVNKLARQQSDSSWKEFEKRFSEVQGDFYTRLIFEYPKLSQNELKLSAFLKLGMNTKEICSITFQSIRAVEAGRLRLRKKLSLGNGENLCMFLQKF